MVAAIVVLYHPDEDALAKLQSSLLGQVDGLIMIDNTPGSSLPKPGFVTECASYVPLGANKGIAEAQNIGIELSRKGGYSHVLLLDQDSAASPGMVSKMFAAERMLLAKGIKVAAVTPQIIDARTGASPVAVRYAALGVLSAKKIYRDCTVSHPEQTDNFISSGSLIRVEIFQTLGMMRSDLFIDYVDTEWALRAHVAGYRSFCVPNATLSHRVGDNAKSILGKDIYLYSVLRYCYRIRNSVYLTRLKTMGWRWRAYNATRIPYHISIYLMFSTDRLKTFRLLLKACRDGWSGKLGPYVPPAEKGPAQLAPVAAEAFSSSVRQKAYAEADNQQRRVG